MAFRQFASARSDTAVSWVQMQEARRLFFKEGGDPGSLVPDLIARSWRRCLPMDGQSADAPEPISHDQLSEHREAHGRLWHHALPELESLAEALAEARVVTVLAGPDCMAIGSTGYFCTSASTEPCSSLQIGHQVAQKYSTTGSPACCWRHWVSVWLLPAVTARSNCTSGACPDAMLRVCQRWAARKAANRMAMLMAQERARRRQGEGREGVEDDSFGSCMRESIAAKLAENVCSGNT